MNAIGTPRWDIPTQTWVEPENCTNDETRRLSGSDPGRSPQSDCVHSFFAVKDGFRCCHCWLKLDRGEP